MTRPLTFQLQPKHIIQKLILHEVKQFISSFTCSSYPSFVACHFWSLSCFCHSYPHKMNYFHQCYSFIRSWCEHTVLLSTESLTFSQLNLPSLYSFEAILCHIVMSFLCLWKLGSVDKTGRQTCSTASCTLPVETVDSRHWGWWNVGPDLALPQHFPLLC